MHSISYETKLKLKDLFVCLAEDEVKIERLRQVLASIPEFEPYEAGSEAKVRKVPKD
jgi:hypothetical protein